MSKVVTPAVQTHSDYLKLASDVVKIEPTPFGLLACQCAPYRQIGLADSSGDPLLLNLKARVLSCEEVKTSAQVNGKKATTASAARSWEVVLSDTVIIPTGGGQPHDTGRIGEAIVSDVNRKGFDPVHTVDRPIEVGAEVDVSLDFPRRLDHMIQHTAQHLISAVFERLGLDTGSWALCPFPAPSYIELPRAPTAEEIISVEDQCNELIAANVRCHVDVKSSSGAKLDSLPDSMPEGGVIRTVYIGGLDGSPQIDENPCGGTHLPSLGMMGSVHILPNTQSIRGGHARVFFLAGRRVAAFTRSTGDAARAVAAELGCAVEEAPERTAQLGVASKDSFRRATKLQELLAAREAKDFVSSLPENAVGLLILREDATHELDYIKSVVNKSLDLFGTRPHLIAVLSTLAAAAKTPSPLMIVGADQQVASVAAKLKAAFGSRWKGGGKGRVQGKLDGAFSEADIATVRSALADA